MHRRLLVRAACTLITVLTLTTCQLSSAQAAPVKGHVNAVTPVLKAAAEFCPASRGSSQRALCALKLSHAGPYFVTCLSCGSANASKFAKTWVNRTGRQLGPFTSRASVLVVATQPEHIGRYELYRPVGLDMPHPHLRLYRQGCVGANISAETVLHNFHDALRNLPTVPCKPPGDLVGSAYTAGLNELTTGATYDHALFFGRVSKPMWLTVVQMTASHVCKSDPLAYSQSLRKARDLNVWHVHGEFNEGLQLRALYRTGQFCIYLQAGGLYRGMPDGWLVSLEYNPYFTGDVVTGPTVTDLSAAGATTVALSGNAPRTETLKSYDLLRPCPEYSVEAQMSSFGGSTMQVTGAFTETLTTATFAQSGYVCSYLDDDYETVAMATDQVSVGGTQLKDQADYAETADLAVAPVSDPIGDAGAAGASIAAGQTVYVRCVLNGIGLAPFDPVWYELASSPWGDAYYAPAYAFYNNGQTSGAVSNGQRWDPTVPFCNAT